MVIFGCFLPGALAQPSSFLELEGIVDLDECGLHLGSHVDLACNGEGVIFLSDATRRKVFYLAENGCLRPLELEIHGYFRPYGIAFDEEGRLYVANPHMHEILVFGQDGKLERTLGGFNSQLRHPVDLAVSEEKLIYVLDDERNAVVVLEDTAKVKGFIPLPIGLGRPMSISVIKGKIFVVIDGVPAILALDMKGHARWLGEEGYEIGQLKVPIDLDANGEQLYVLDFLNNAVQAYDGEGNLVKEYILYKYLLNGPVAICVCDERLYVANAADQILKFKIRYATTGIEHSLLAEELFALGYYREAIEEFNRAVDLGYSPAEVHFSLGLCFYLLGFYEEAKEEFQEALEGKPHDITVIFQLANTFYRMGRYGEAAELYELVLKNEPRHLQALYNLGKSYLGLGKINEAERQFKKALEFFPEFTDALIELAAILLNKGGLTEAEELLRQVLEKSPTDGRALYFMGRVYFELGRHRKAAEFFEEASSFGPLFIESLYYLGLCYLELGELEEAIACFRRVLEIDPSNEEARRRLEEIKGQK